MVVMMNESRISGHSLCMLDCRARARARVGRCFCCFVPYFCDAVCFGLVWVRFYFVMPCVLVSFRLVSFCLLLFGLFVVRQTALPQRRRCLRICVCVCRLVHAVLSHFACNLCTSTSTCRRRCVFVVHLDVVRRVRGRRGGGGG